MALVLGIDDAGRGPILGPMILAGVLINKKDEEFLKKSGVKDSKQVLHPFRMKLSEIIKGIAIDFKVVLSYPEEIDKSIRSKINLNTLEATKAAEIINYLTEGKKEPIKVIVDCPSTNTSAWKKTLTSFVKNPSLLTIYCEHKADINHVSVSAASIIAKVVREEEVSKIRKQYKDYGETGSGYPSDPSTKEFLKKNGKKLENSGIFRKTWQTWKALFPEKDQTTLVEFR